MWNKISKINNLCPAAFYPPYVLDTAGAYNVKSSSGCQCWLCFDPDTKGYVEMHPIQNLMSGYTGHQSLCPDTPDVERHS